MVVPFFWFLTFDPIPRTKRDVVRQGRGKIIGNIVEVLNMRETTRTYDNPILF